VGQQRADLVKVEIPLANSGDLDLFDVGGKVDDGRLMCLDLKG